MKSDEDLTQLLEMWKEYIVFTKRQLRNWPSISEKTMLLVLKVVYGLSYTKICQGFIRPDINDKIPKQTVQELSDKHGVKELASFPEFYRTTGVGFVVCTNGDSLHAIVFETNEIETKVLFRDTAGSSQDETWFSVFAKHYVVLAVYVVTCE
jgi:hypothetical protein